MKKSDIGLIGLPVKGGPIAKFIKSNLRSRGMDYEGKEVEQVWSVWRGNARVKR